MQTNVIFKLCSEAEWAQAEVQGAFLGSAVDIRDGFIHFSAPHQVRETAARHFRGQHGLLLLAFDASALGEALRWEPSQGGELFPHLYGPLPVTWCVGRWSLETDAAGEVHFPAAVDLPSLA